MAGVWNHIHNSHGIPKGLCTMLEEHDANTRGMLQDEMRRVLGSHPDFKDDKSRLEHFLLVEKGHIAYLLPKFTVSLTL